MVKRTEPSLPLDIIEQPEVISGQKVGYARVSAGEQNLDRQVAQLKAEKCSPTSRINVAGDHGSGLGWMKRCVMSARVKCRGFCF